MNINFQSEWLKAKGGFLILGYQKSFSPPLPLATLIDQINVHLTPFIS